MKSKILFTLFILMMCFSISSLAKEPIEIEVDGRKITTDVEPIIINNRVIVPIRVVSQALGAYVEYKDNTVIIVSSDDEKTITTLPIGQKEMTIKTNDKEENVKLDVPAVLKNGRTMVPIRAISNILGAYVSYENKNKIKVNVQTPTTLVNGKTLKCVTNRGNMLTGYYIDGYYGNVNVGRVYKLIIKGIGKEIKEPENYGECPFANIEIDYCLQNSFKFYSDVPNNISYKTVGIVNYDIYANDVYDVSTIIHDMNTDKWYEYNAQNLKKIRNILSKLYDNMFESLCDNYA